MTEVAIDVAELLRVIDRAPEAGHAPLLLDLRNDDEFAAWRIEGRRAVEMLHIPYFAFLEETEQAIARLPQGREILAVCAKGGSSAMVVELLRDAGIPARTLEGGMIAYGDHLAPVRVPLAGTAAHRFELWQVQRRGKGCLSYVLIAGGEAVVVDPARHVEFYQRFAAEHGARILHVFDTHVHADHLSGGAALAARNKASYFVSSGARPEVDGLRDGQRVRLGDGRVELELITTPGHTPGSCSYLIDGQLLLTGDVLFVNGIGRPDLGNQAAEWARALYHTLHTKLARLSDATMILPAHSSGMDEADAHGVVCATLGQLRRGPEFRIATEDAFVRAMVAAVATPPARYADIIQANAELRAIDAEAAAEWELGKNQCAASRHAG